MLKQIHVVSLSMALLVESLYAQVPKYGLTFDTVRQVENTPADDIDMLFQKIALLPVSTYDTPAVTLQVVKKRHINTTTVVDNSDTYEFYIEPEMATLEIDEPREYIAQVVHEETKPTRLITNSIPEKKVQSDEVSIEEEVATLPDEKPIEKITKSIKEIISTENMDMKEMVLEDDVIVDDVIVDDVIVDDVVVDDVVVDDVVVDEAQEVDVNIDEVAVENSVSENDNTVVQEVPQEVQIEVQAVVETSTVSLEEGIAMYQKLYEGNRKIFLEKSPYYKERIMSLFSSMEQYDTQEVADVFRDIETGSIEKIEALNILKNMLQEVKK